MRILYIFPHPDDESFGPAPAIHAQIRQGHEVHLLTLTKGEATKQRFRLQLSKEQMGAVRVQEMHCVKEVLGLHGMTILDLPDGQLKEMNPITLEAVIEKEIRSLNPDILVTYAVHGVSGFLDHLVTHAAVKRAFCKMQEEQDGNRPRRLALFTRMGETDTKGKFRLQASADEDIQFIESCTEQDMIAFHNALDCYKTYQEVIEASGVKRVVTDQVPFELFGEKHAARLTSIADKLPSDFHTYGLL